MKAYTLQLKIKKNEQVDLIPYLQNEQTLNELYGEQNININSECVQAYMQDSLSLESEIRFFDIELTNDDLEIQLDGKKYIQLFPIELGIEFYTYFAQEFKDRQYTETEKAKRFLDYRLNDA